MASRMSGQFFPSISQRGNFFDDSFFEGFQEDFDSAVQDVLGRWGGRSVLADNLASQRRRRKDVASEGGEDSLKANVSDAEDKYSIVLDMAEFLSGDIAVRTSGRSAVVEASAAGRKASRKFPLPRDTNVEGVTAAMSDEGILSIMAPKKKYRTGEGRSLPDAGTPGKEDKFVSSTKFDIGGLQETTYPSRRCSEEESIPRECSERKESLSDVMDRILPITRRGRFFRDDYFQNIWKDFDAAFEEFGSRRKASYPASSAMQQQVPKQELKPPGECCSKEPFRRYERMNSYKNCRGWNSEEDTLASAVTQDGNCYKVVLDVQDFVEGDLKVQASDGVVEVTGGRAGVTFKKSFSLPGFKRPEDVTAAVSTEGVMTITAPK